MASNPDTTTQSQSLFSLTLGFPVHRIQQALPVIPRFSMSTAPSVEPGMKRVVHKQLPYYLILVYTGHLHSTSRIV